MTPALTGGVGRSPPGGAPSAAVETKRSHSPDVARDLRIDVRTTSQLVPICRAVTVVRTPHARWPKTSDFARALSKYESLPRLVALYPHADIADFAPDPDRPNEVSSSRSEPPRTSARGTFAHASFLERSAAR